MLTDAGGMNKSFVRQIHQVIHQQNIVAVYVIGASVEDPVGIGTPGQVWNLRCVRKRGIADPHPHEAMFLQHRVRFQMSALVNSLLPGHPHALAALVEFQSVIAADQVVALQVALGKW